MNEIKPKSVDIVFFSPPYNIGTYYGSYTDKLKLEKYFNFMKNVIKECAKTLKKDGRLIIEIADSIFFNNKFIQLAGLIQKYAVVNANMFLETRHINFINTKNSFELPNHGFDKNYLTSSNTHSNCHQILVFNKSKIEYKTGEILYFNYKHSNEHPCAEPKELIDFIIKKYFRTGMNILDPFMGTANLGVSVLKNGGSFSGYEIAEKFYNSAKKKLQSVL